MASTNQRFDHMLRPVSLIWYAPIAPGSAAAAAMPAPTEATTAGDDFATSPNVPSWPGPALWALVGATNEQRSGDDAQRDAMANGVWH